MRTIHTAKQFVQRRAIQAEQELELDDQQSVNYRYWLIITRRSQITAALGGSPVLSQHFWDAGFFLSLQLVQQHHLFSAFVSGNFFCRTQFDQHIATSHRRYQYICVPDS